MLWDGFEVLTLQPDFSRPPKPQAFRQFDQVDLSPAPRYTQFIGDEVLHSLNFEMLLHGEAEILELEEFFHRHKGKWKPFFVPSWHAELNPVGAVQDGATEIVIEPVGYQAAYLSGNFTDSLGRRIFLLNDDGDMHLANVTAVAVDGPTEVLTITEPVVGDFTEGHYIIGFVYGVRSLQDDLELEFMGPGQARAALALQQVFGAEAGGETEQDFLERALTVSYTDEVCKDTIVLEFNHASTFESHYVFIQYSTAVGVWNELLAGPYTATNAELTARKARVLINNQFGVETKWRIKRMGIVEGEPAGTPKYSVVATSDAPTVAMPIMTGLTNSSFVEMGSLDLPQVEQPPLHVFDPEFGTCEENAEEFIRTLLQPANRTPHVGNFWSPREPGVPSFFYVQQTAEEVNNGGLYVAAFDGGEVSNNFPQGVVENVLTMSHPDPDVEIRVETGAAHPTSSSPLYDSHQMKLGGVQNNIGGQRITFGCCVKARAYKDGCRSPLCYVLVDHRTRIVTNDVIGIDVKGFSISSGQSCAHPRNPLSENPIFHSDSACYPGPEIDPFDDSSELFQGFKEAAKASTCARLNDVPTANATSGRIISAASSSRIDYIDWTGWQETAVGWGIFYAAGAGIMLKKPAVWLQAPQINVQFAGKLGTMEAELGTPTDIEQAIALGQMNQFDQKYTIEFSQDFYASPSQEGDAGPMLSSLNEIIPTFECTEIAESISAFTGFETIHTRRFEVVPGMVNGTVLTAVAAPETLPPLGDPPDNTPPEEDPEFGFESFDTYAESEDFEVGTFNDQENWAGAWTFESLPVNAGHEPFEGVEDIEAMEWGEGFEGMWVLAQSIAYGADDLETYSDGEILLGIAFAGSNVTEEEGLFDEDDPLGIGATKLTGGSGWASRWVFSLPYRMTGMDSFDDYETAQDLSTLNEGTLWNGAWTFEDL